MTAEEQKKLLAAQASLDQQLAGAVKTYLAGGLNFLDRLAVNHGDNSYRIMGDCNLAAAFVDALPAKQQQLLLALGILAYRQLAILAFERIKGD